MFQKTHCDLCGLRLPKRAFVSEREGVSYSFCCAGCRHVFELLAESGLIGSDYKESDLYKQCLALGIIGNPEKAPAEQELSAEELKGAKELLIHVDGMWCSACSWLIEKVLGSRKGVLEARVNFASDTARIYYRPEEIAPSEITAAVDSLGYKVLSRDELQEASVRERNALLIKMGVALFLLMNVMFFSYVLYIGYFQEVAGEMRAGVPYILLALTIPAVFWCGLPIHRKAFGSLRAGAPTMELLLSISILSAFFYSIYALVSAQGEFYFDTAVGLVTLLLVGKLIEHSAKHRASESIHRLYQMLPKKVRIKTDAGERLVSVDTLQEGDRFVVRPGEKIPTDGRIAAGTTSVDESLLTGESKPIARHAGDMVMGSSMNLHGVIEVDAARVGDETLLSGIIRMVEGALARKSPLERTVDRIARVFVPAVISIALVTGLVVFSQGAGLEAALLRAITVLVIACPCALGMATPLAVAAGIGFAAGRGVLIRDGSVLGKAARIDTVLFDKTGTLTEGRFDLLDVVTGGDDAGGAASEEVLATIAEVEKFSNHPIGEALVRAWEEGGRATGAARDVVIDEGKGISGTVGDQKGGRVLVGTEAFVREGGFVIPDALAERGRGESARGRTVVFFGIEEGDRVGCAVLGDRLKSSAPAAVAGLREMGASLWILSGDSAATTAAIAEAAGIDAFRAEVLPQDKIDEVVKLQTEGSLVAMVGDGVNDAPALAQADVGIAMGHGTEIAVESSSFTLLRDDLGLVPLALDTSKRTVRTIRQNLSWAFLYNVAGIFLAVWGVLNPLFAAGAMLVSSLSVIANSLRLREGRGKMGKKLVEFFLPWLEPEEG